MTYGEREQLKDDGRELMADTVKSMEERKRGLLMVIESHYERSLEAWGDRRAEQHGTYTEFVQSWLVANGDDVYEQDVASALRKDFPPPSRPRIGKGRSYWGTA